MADKKDDQKEAKQEQREVAPDPVVVAALIDDPDDTDEEKARRAEVLGADDEESDEDEDTDEDQASDGKDTSKKKPASDEDDDGEDSEDEGEQGKPDAKKPESDEGKKPEGQDLEDDGKLSRKDRRDQRKQRFIDSIREKQPQASSRDPLIQVQPYQPINYDEQEEFKTNELEQDRNKFGDYRFAQGARIERFYAQQERFWDNVEHDNELLLMQPDYKFLDETSPDFDENRAGDINELYLELVGYQENQVLDPNTRQPIIDPATGKPKVTATVRRTDIPYGKFVQSYVQRMKDYASEEAAEQSKEIAKQRSNQGIRPSGARKSAGFGKLRPGMISAMSDEELEKHEAEIDAQIAEML